MAPRKKATKRTTKRKAPAKTARRTSRKATKKTAKRATKKSAKKATKKSAKKATKRTAKKATKRTAKKGRTAKAPAAGARRSVKFSTRKAGTFTQTDLIDSVQARYPDMPKSQARDIVGDVLDTLQTAIKKTDRVRLKGIGTITKKKVPARKGGKLVKNPFTGELVKQKPRPASVKVKMTPSKEIKQA